MQYILTEEEYKRLKDLAEYEKRRNAKVINELCIMVADHMPITEWPGTKKDPKPWGCVNSREGEWYCDDCPVQHLCLENKIWSK